MSRRRDINELSSINRKELEKLTLEEMQRIRNVRSAHDKADLVEQIDEELVRRSPMQSWSCLRCGKGDYHTKQMASTGGLFTPLTALGDAEYHVVVCNYCGKAEFYSVLREGTILWKQ